MQQDDNGFITEITFDAVGSGKNYVDRISKKLYIYRNFSESIDVWDLQTKEMKSFEAISRPMNPTAPPFPCEPTSSPLKISIYPTLNPTFHVGVMVKETEMKTQSPMDTVQISSSPKGIDAFLCIVGIFGGLIAACLSLFCCMVHRRYKRMSNVVPEMEEVAQNSETVASYAESKEIVAVYSDCDEPKIQKVSFNELNEVEMWLKGLELEQYAANFNCGKWI